MDTIQQIKEIVDAIGGIGPALGSVIILGFVLVKLISMFNKFDDNLKETNKIYQELSKKIDLDIELAQKIIENLKNSKRKHK